MKLTLRQKILYTIIGIILFFGSLASISTYYVSKNILSNIKQENLLIATTIQSHKTREVFNHSQNLVKTIANQSNIISLFENSTLKDQEHVVEHGLLHDFNINNMYSAIYLMDQTGLTLVSTDESFINKNYNFRDYFQQAVNDKPHIDVSVGVTSNKLGYYFSHPIKSSTDNIVGVAVVKLKPEIIHNSLELTEPGKIMLVDQYGVVIYSNDKSKQFHSLAPLSSKTLTEISQKKRYANKSIKSLTYDQVFDRLSSLSQPQSFLLDNQSDRKEENISAAQIGDLPFYILNQTNSNQVSRFATKNALIITVFVLIASICAGAIISLLINKFLQPLPDLTKIAKAISAGDYSQQSKTKSHDELGLLSQAFNQMITAIKQSRIEISQKVQFQTQEIVKKSQDLEDQQKAILNVLEDVEIEKQNLTLERDKINAILHSIGDAVFVVDNNLNITLFNQVAASLSGHALQEAIGANFNTILKFVDEKTNESKDQFVSQVIKTGKAKTMDKHTALIRKDGIKIPVADSAAPLVNKNGQVTGCVVVFRNVTKEREVDRMKTEFISLASHQLRTPLSAMKWFLEMLLNGEAGAITKEQKEYLVNIDQSNERMISLINSLLNISRIESGRIIIDPQPTDINKLINGILLELKPKLSEKNQTPTFNIQPNLPKVNLDSKLIRHVYINLLTNAIKYTKKAGQITVVVKIQGDQLVTQIADNGVGIPKHQQKKVFDKFFRADNIIKMETDGTGLGLYLVKSVVESSGGKIWFNSKEGTGTTFWFSLPLKGMSQKKGEVTIDS
jgi:PAS domain S-box-containing protein